MQMFAFSRTEAGIRRLQQERLPKPVHTVPDMQPLMDEIAELKRRISDLEAKSGNVVEFRPLKSPFKRIEERACKVFKTTPAQLRAVTRNKRIVGARHFVFYWACRLTPLSTTQIGKLVGGMDHTTVMHGRDAYRKRREKMGRHLRLTR